MRINWILPNQSSIVLVWKILGKNVSQKNKGNIGGKGCRRRLGSGSFHSFLPNVPLAFTTSSQLLKKARYRQGNHQLIRSFIENRQLVTYYKLERCKHAFVHSQPHRQPMPMTTQRCIIAVQCMMTNTKTE